MVDNLNNTCKNVFRENDARGFWPSNPQDRNIGELIALIHSELSEALEADRKGRFVNAECNFLESKYSKWKDWFEAEIKDTFQDEIADTFIRLMDLCGGLKIDIEYHIKKKLEYNLLREHKHGKKY